MGRYVEESEVMGGVAAPVLFFISHGGPEESYEWIPLSSVLWVRVETPLFDVISDDSDRRVQSAKSQ